MGHQAWIHTALMMSAAVIGLLIGLSVDTGDVASSLIEPFLMLMLFLVFLSIDLGGFRESFSNVRFLASAVIINFVWTPVLAYVLGLAFFEGSVDLRIGLLMLLVTPCTDWYLVFTSVAKGNVALSSTLLPVNLVLQIALMPVFLLLFIGQSADFDIASMLGSMAFVLVIPFAASLAVKVLATKASSVGRFKGVLDDNCDNLQLFFLCLAIVAMFASESATLTDNLGMFVTLLIPLALFFVSSYAASVTASRLQGYPYEDSTSLVFTTMARNSPLALAIAVAVFPDSPLIALVLMIGPLIELPVLSLTADLRLRRRFQTEQF